MSDTLAKEFNEEMLLLFKRTGEAVGYWPRYFLRKVRQVGGLKMAQDLLQPTTAHKGFGRLAEEKKLELSVEYMVGMWLGKWRRPCQGKTPRRDPPMARRVRL